jgi:general stress protein 26
MAAGIEKHLYDLIQHFKVAMVITQATGGGVHVRPMAVAQIAAGAQAYFATSIESPKVAEIEADPRLVISFQGKSDYAVLYGTGEIVRDRALIDKLWDESWRLWFPGGKDDSTLCLLRLAPERGEYWDRSGAQGLRFLFEGVKAILQGTTAAVDDDPEQHAKVRLGKQGAR